MNTLSQHASPETLDQIALDLRHFEQAPAAFFKAWKRGAELVGPTYFGDGTQSNLEHAADKWDLRPDVPLIRRAIGVMSAGEKVFLAAMVSFYNTRTGGALLKRVGVQGLADLNNLDLERRQVIATLLLNYTGW